MAVDKVASVRRSPAMAAAAFCMDHADLAAVLGFAAWALLAGHEWTWLPSVVALALTWDLSEPRWDSTKAPLPGHGQLVARGNILAIGALVTLALLPAGTPALPPALALAVATGDAARRRIRSWSNLSTGHAPWGRLYRAINRMDDAGGRPILALLLVLGLIGQSQGVRGSIAVAIVLATLTAAVRHSDPVGDAEILDVKVALAGLLTGGVWDPKLADLRPPTSPVDVEVRDGRPVRIVIPLPKGIATERLAAARIQLMTALAESWGLWTFTPNVAKHMAIAEPEPDQDPVTVAVRLALAGLIVSGGLWDPRLAAIGYAPVTVEQEDGEPVRVEFPLPPGWRATEAESLSAEAAARMAKFGLWIVRPDSSGRHAVGVLAPPLPTFLPYDGRPAGNGSGVWLGTGRATAMNVKNGLTGVQEGDLYDIVWDPTGIGPHAIAVGETGMGKSQTVQLAMMQLALADWKLVLIDPKQVEFGAWEGRRNVLAVSVELADQVRLLQLVRQEMDDRYSLMKAAGVNHVEKLTGSDRPPRMLVVVDEVVELLAPSPAKNDEGKAKNELKAQAAASISELLRLGRAAGVHLLIAGQRADRTILSGEAQNNIGARILQGPAEQVERNMIGVGDVLPTPGIKGRAVARVNGLQSEVQIAYLDIDRLDDYLPKVEQPAPTGPADDEELAPSGVEDDEKPAPTGPEQDQAPARAGIENEDQPPPAEVANDEDQAPLGLVDTGKPAEIDDPDEDLSVYE